MTEATFDRAFLRQSRARSAGSLPAHGFLLDAATERLIERLADVRRGFSRTLLLGAWGEAPRAALAAGGKAGTIVALDPAATLLPAAGPRLVAEPETLPFAPASFDLILSPLLLQSIDDLPGALLQLRQALKADGLLLAALIGGASLTELRQAWIEAELTTSGGAFPRVAPMLDLRQAAGLLQRAGFALPLADAERLTLTYATPLALMREWKAAGLGHGLEARSPRPLGRATLAAACAAYQQRFGRPDGRVSATVELIMLAGWAPDPTQPRPLPRGSGSHSLADALATPAGRRPDPTH